MSQQDTLCIVYISKMMKPEDRTNETENQGYLFHVVSTVWEIKLKTKP